MRNEKGAHDGQAHARAFATGSAFPAPVELFENERQIDRADAGAVVFDKKLKASAGATAAQSDAAAGRRIAGSIFNQVAKDAAQQMGIEPGGLIRLFSVDDDAVPGQGSLRLRHGLVEKGARTLRHGADLDHLRVNLSHFDGFADQPIEP